MFRDFKTGGYNLEGKNLAQRTLYFYNILITFTAYTAAKDSRTRNQA
jgi:hypothetical protein